MHARREARSLVHMLRDRAGVQPADRAYTFLHDGEIEHAQLSYETLDRRSRAIASALRARVPAGARALLLYPPGLDFIAAFFGCLYAGVVAVPAHLPHNDRAHRTADRLRAIAEDSTPDAVLTTSDLLRRWPSTAGGLRTSAAGAWAAFPAAWIATDAIDDEAATGWRDPDVNRQTLAFLQYTSGSTSTPKGVMVSHGNLLHNLAYAAVLAPTDASSVFVSWLPVLHDMGLIEGVLQPAFAGRPAYLMAPTAFLQRPARWLKAISRYSGTRSGGPNFAYDLCVRRITAEDRAALDLRSWRAAYTGAEPIRRETLTSFARAFAPTGFDPSAIRPSYGLAEATLLVSSGRWTCEGPDAPDDPEHDGAPVSCGSPTCGTDVAIVHPHTRRRCRPGDVGEIWVAGPSVAQGYWNRPHETARTFRARTADGDGPFLKTGDLGRVVAGALAVTGRIKDVLIVRGRKHYPQDLEQTAQRLHVMIPPGGAAAVGLTRGISGDRIGLVAEIDARHLTAPSAADALIASIRLAVAEQHGVQLHTVALVAPRALPKTTSGKLQRFACREAFLAGRMPTFAVWQEAIDVGS